MSLASSNYFEMSTKTPQQGNGIVAQAGKLLSWPKEITVSKFSNLTGICRRHVARLCEEGLLKHRRLTPKPRSKILIDGSEIARYKALEGDV